MSFYLCCQRLKKLKLSQIGSKMEPWRFFSPEEEPTRRWTEARMRFSNEPRSLRAFRVETRSLDTDDENKDDVMSSDSEIKEVQSKLFDQNLAATCSRLELSQQVASSVPLPRFFCSNTSLLFLRSPTDGVTRI